MTTGMIGLNRVLFPLNDENRPNVKRPSGRQMVALKAKTQHIDSLANLGGLASVIEKKKRRDKRERDVVLRPKLLAEEGAGGKKNHGDSPPKIITVIHPRCTSIPMDSLASLGNPASLPKTVSPPSTKPTKRKPKTKKTATKGKTRNAKRPRVRKNTRAYLKDLTGKNATRKHVEIGSGDEEGQTRRGKSGNRKNPAVGGSVRCTGLGAMFGIASVPKNKICEAMETIDEDIEIPQPCQPQPAPATEVLILSENDSSPSVANKQLDSLEDSGYSNIVLVSPKWTVGTRIRKKFGGKGWSYGQVESFDAMTGFYFIAYNDGDGEEFDDQDMHRYALKKKKKEVSITGQDDAKIKSFTSGRLDGDATEETKDTILLQSSKQPARRSKRQTRPSDGEETTSNPTANGRAEENSPPALTGENANPSQEQTRLDELLPNDRDPPLRRSKRRRSTDTMTPDTTDTGKQNDRGMIKPPRQENGAYHEDNKTSIRIASNDPSKNESQNRRSKRNTVPPNRLGLFVSDAIETPSEERKRPQQKQTRDGQKGKKTFVDESPSSDHNVSTDAEGWTQDELCLLRKAHQEVDPKSFAFWDEVAEQVGSKSAGECRDRWFSFVKTPAVAVRKPKVAQASQTPATNTDDDIFNATPMKGLFHMPDMFGSALKLGIGSAIKVATECSHEASTPPLNGVTHGYKTYIRNVKRDVNKSSKYKLPKISKPKNNKKTLSFKDIEGDIEVKGRLSPGGTLRVNAESSQAEELAEEDIFLSEDDNDVY